MIPETEVESLLRHAEGFTVTGYRFEFSGYCSSCLPVQGRTGTARA
jgi:Fe2+ or Zn2+ uptake regulation protein